MRCSKKNALAAFGGVAILAMPIAAHAQALGLRLGGNTVLGGTSTSGTANNVLNVGGLTTGLGSLGTTLGGVTSGITTGGSSLVSVTVPSITTTGLVAANTGPITANILGSSGVLTASVPSINANVANGLATIGTPSIGAGVLTSNSIATITTGGPLNVTTLGNPPLVNVSTGTNPGVNVNIGRGLGGGVIPTVTLGAGNFFSGNSVSAGGATEIFYRMNGGGGGGGGGSAGADSNSGESSAQVCDRVLRRPGSYQRAVVTQCRRVMAQLIRRQ